VEAPPPENPQGVLLFFPQVARLAATSIDIVALE